MNKIGVFVCHCGLNIASKVDVVEVAEYASKLPGVVISKDYKYMCSDPGANLIKDSIKEFDLDGIVIASCSPRMHEHTFRGVAKDGGLNPFTVEITNIREQCSWAHEDPAEATQKAKALVRSAVSKAALLEPLEASRTPVTPEALVVGGGIAGIQAALNIADSGFKVHLVEKEPTVGGRMAQLDKTFPTLDCSSCILTPKMMEVYHHPNVDLLTYAEVESIEGSIGNYKVKVRKKARYVDIDKCTGCNECASACRLAGRVVDEFNMGMGKRSACYIPFPQAVPLKSTIDPNSCLMLRFGRCGDGPLCVKACEPGAIDFSQKDETLELNVGAVVIATGYDLLEANRMFEYGYGRSPDVITTMQLERLISSSGPTHGEVVLPSSGKHPTSVTFILCVGSRDETQCSWCCRIGCMSALKHVYLLREKLGEEVEINICYTDIRSFGKGYEEFYRNIRSKNTNFFRGRPSEVRVKKEGFLIDIFDTTTDKLFEIRSDMVVLVPALVPRSDSQELARTFKLSRSSDGFLLEAHPKLRPMDTFVNGTFIAGCAQGPKDISDTVSQACGAASRAVGILSKEELENEPLIAWVDPEVCVGCGVCVEVCAYSARNINDVTGIAEVDEALCAGCGACVSSCPSNACTHKNYTKRQLVRMIDEVV
ncbi:MAG: CoB--CoM heterodisulfide reductase iron-sulfur subunit A family protein [Candidatus Thermoplasmatota archaeon]|nr:CoB--CoM heterodisulfide reductase iron-sulfur subunit A family protein [Candidatus Thermoplasmatota archaeon]